MNLLGFFRNLIILLNLKNLIAQIFLAGSTYQSGTRTQYDLMQQQYAEKLESFLKDTFKQPNIPWMFFIRILIFSLLGISFFNMLQRSELISIAILLYIFIIFYTTFDRDQLKYLTYFQILSLVLIIYEVVWFLFVGFSYTSSAYFDGGAEGGLRGFIFFTAIITFFMKVALGLSFMIQRAKAMKGENEPLNTSANNPLN